VRSQEIGRSGEPRGTILTGGQKVRRTAWDDFTGDQEVRRTDKDDLSQEIQEVRRNGLIRVLTLFDVWPPSVDLPTFRFLSAVLIV
jgi:hypothetical protein